MRIALVNPTLVGSTGGERQLLKLAIELQKKGHEVEVFTNKADEKKCFPELISRVKVNVVPYPIKCPLFYYNMFLGMRGIGHEISRRKFDVVNIHNFPSEWAAYFLRKTPVPVVWLCNEPPFWYFLPKDRENLRFYNKPLNIFFDKLSVRSVDRVLVLSDFMGNIMKGVYHRDFDVVRSGVDAENFRTEKNEDYKKKRGLDGSFVLLQVGTLVSYKRQEDAIRVLNILSKKYDNVKLVLVGEAEEKEKLTELTDAYRLNDKVQFWGSITNDRELREAYAACDVFLFPSYQSWSLVTLEAMASKKPVIVSRNCGVSEIIDNGVNGFAVDHGDYEKIAEYVEMLMMDKNLMDKVSNNAYDYVCQNLTWEKWAENMEAQFIKTVEASKK